MPAGTRHNLVNAGSVDLKLYTVYAPPQHAAGTVHRTKAEADADDEHAERSLLRQPCAALGWRPASESGTSTLRHQPRCERAPTCGVKPTR